MRNYPLGRAGRFVRRRLQAELTHSARAGPRSLPMDGYFTAKLTVTTACVSIGWLASVAGR